MRTYLLAFAFVLFAPLLANAAPLVLTIAGFDLHTIGGVLLAALVAEWPIILATLIVVGLLLLAKKNAKLEATIKADIDRAYNYAEAHPELIGLGGSYATKAMCATKFLETELGKKGITVGSVIADLAKQMWADRANYDKAITHPKAAPAPVAK